jgi:hypothetical protein
MLSAEVFCATQMLYGAPPRPHCLRRRRRAPLLRPRRHSPRSLVSQHVYKRWQWEQHVLSSNHLLAVVIRYLPAAHFLSRSALCSLFPVNAKSDPNTPSFPVHSLDFPCPSHPPHEHCLVVFLALLFEKHTNVRANVCNAHTSDPLLTYTDIGSCWRVASSGSTSSAWRAQPLPQRRHPAPTQSAPHHPAITASFLRNHVDPDADIQPPPFALPDPNPMFETSPGWVWGVFISRFWLYFDAWR